ncbi:MAG: DNA translocase FtsK [Chlamydiales bacterium]|nr:DNA translocase FtsK [Chlamydiales bacterium]
MAKRKKKQHNFSHLLKGSALLVCALFVGLSLLSYCNKDPSKNWLGLLGYVMGWSLNYLLGLSSFLLPIFCGWVGFKTITHQQIPKFKIKLLLFGTSVISLSLLLTMVAYKSPGLASFFERWVHSDYFPRKESYNPASLRHYLGGVPLHHLYVDTSLNLRDFLGGVGSFLVFFASLVLSFVLLTELPVKELFEKTKKKMRAVKPKLALMRPVRRRPFAPLEEEKPASILMREDPLKKITRINIPEARPAQKLKETKPVVIGDYELPSPTLLTEVIPVDQSSLKSDLKRQAEVLEETLLSFSIEAKVGDIHCGPTITSFEVHPAVGVKVQKIKALESDIALNMQAKSIRIIAPIPGKAAVGIEVPNAKPQEVSFRELLENYRHSPKKAEVPLLLGKLVNGENLWSDLTKIPHLIIAGATGAGKSVCINTIVMSIVMNARPDEIKLVMVDPKKVELTAYTHLPHMLAPVITEPGGACAALSWLVKEMERRYEMLRLLGIRNITGFNGRKPNKGLEESLDLEIPKKMPYIVVIIDELADLMMVAQSDIETPIARIAQMARAVGIHLILATQRPSREVITGIIKANFPSRIAFKVSSRINSQIIIDENGAELLLGNGDMLFMPPGSSSLCRTQGAFIRDDDINQVIHFCCSQAPTNYLIPSFDNYRDVSEGPVSDSDAKRDALYEDAKELVLGTGNASTTFLQRKMKVGYARAASLMDQLEENGIIGPSEGAKARKIYYPQQEETS